ncbi:hypothetical protein FNV43_RR26866 [Rhamnella rubrinervis]|uniref:Fe2OG dioxygenase domain-containing protein n=1 Tax=Rhamnella rubrinervis TaxID=2594499 RepID=A0A8K0DVR7_9ROSA|nr:hypothetical protein FNV43_RR26866 [Rhamnella rubrinervis]
MASTVMITNAAEYDRAKELKHFDESKMGVKGLLDSGLTTIPKIFIHPPETLSDLKPASHARPESHSIPIIGISRCFDSGRRSAIIDQISRAAREVAFFQITNHGIPLETIDRTMAATKALHEKPLEIKAHFYRREVGSNVRYFSNVDLYHAKSASWRDTFYVKFGPNPLAPEELPEICRKEMVDWDKEVFRLSETLMGEGLGLSTDRFKEMTCFEGRTMIAQYYPHCPQPDLTVGLPSHTDPGVLTVLIPDQTGGCSLQVKYGGVWVGVKPVPGAIVINVGDLLQIISNDEYKSVTHRVLANSSSKPPVSIGVFLEPSNREKLYGPRRNLYRRINQHFFDSFRYRSTGINSSPKR